MRIAPDFSTSLAARLAELAPANSSILTGLSGGVDSVVLLHLLHSLSSCFSWRLTALHVHHGISQNADSWANFCTLFCGELGVPLTVERVDLAPLRHHGIEAAARKLRHAAFARQTCDFVALAHHADDQAETLLLQLLRGAGVRGAGAMPADASQLHPGNTIIRPLLRSTRQEILNYAAAHELRWIEDESNADDSYPRNFLRHRLLPLLEQKFPAYRNTLTRSAQHFAEAGLLLDELARLDAAEALRGDTLAVSALQGLSQPRAKNLLRHFLHGMGAPMPQTVQIDDMLQQLCNARADASLCVAYGGWQVRRHAGRVHVLRAQGSFDRNLVIPWLGEALLEWPPLEAKLIFRCAPGEGVSLAKLRSGQLTLCLRKGGETLRPHPKSALRTLRNLLQEQQVPPWQRDRLPLLYCNDKLVYAVGVGISADYSATSDEEGVSLSVVAQSP